ncbi:transmembrane protein 176B-like [Branchiostoma lanceolatum]|uniref:Hypp5165 protein n=1 Tax=Branchiostoma lanceolatum TaxID=7740 RepID=A0A8K0AF87_BRALA|nr:Hypp5165 [Branchiostoma lanceolatum]
MCKSSGQALLGLGVTLVVLGSISVILGIAAAAAFNWDSLSRISAPIWAGGFVILTGSMGIMAGRNFGRQDGRPNGYIPAFMALSIVGIFVTIAQQSINGVGGSLMGWCFIDSVADAVNNWHRDETASSWCQAAASMHWACIAFGFIEMVMCFASSIFGCVVGGCNCGAPQPQTQGVVFMQAPPNPNMVVTTGVPPGAYAYPQAGYMVQQPGGAPPAYLPPPAQQSAPYPGEQKTQIV